MGSSFEKWFPIGDTTYDSDPTDSHKSYTVFTSAGMKHYYVRVNGKTYYAKPASYTGFDVTTKVPVGKVPAGLVSAMVIQSRKEVE